MNVLWVSNIVFPEAQELLQGHSDSLKKSGGWLIGAAEQLVKQPGIKLYVASVSRRLSKLTMLKGEYITYFILPGGFAGTKRVNHGLEKYWREVYDIVSPDVIHLHGTEFTHGLAYLEACGSKNVCVSIQGLVSASYNYYYYGLSFRQILFSITAKTLLKGGILSGYLDFRRRAKSEISIIQKVRHIIGRTQWDRARTWAINPNATYHYGGETLRREFYESETWSYPRCIPHSIFLSQASYPLKGLHMVLRALPIVLRHYPDTVVRVAGNNMLNDNKWISRIISSDYNIIINKIIRENHLQNHISFTGSLSAQEMCKEYLRSNVFICPSTVENSPNSIGEAQLLGVPVLASYVGGVPDMMLGDGHHMYRFEEVEMLAYKIVDLFDKGGDISTKLMMETAQKRHNPHKNIDDLMNIYKRIIVEQND